MSSQRIGHTSNWIKNSAQAFADTLSAQGEFIVFRAGTVVDLSCEDHVPFDEKGFLESCIDNFTSQEFPDSRLKKKTYEQVREDNQADFMWSQSTPYADQCRKAYGCLMWSGYPLPGGHRDCTKVERIGPVWTTTFTELGPCCKTLTLDENRVLNSSTANNSEGRRLDYMMPEPLAFIEKGKVYIME